MEEQSFKLVHSLKTDGDISLSKYKSARTGMTVCIAEVEGPVVNGYFCVATEAHDDDGLPHTLEHLVFMGSEQYPYKGVLDLLANRCYASGTNAWTDTDHTSYTVTTAGHVGFLNLLPIYLDHILYPTLTDAAFVTEIHHINGEGENAGVVYCEMQGRENTGESRCHLAMLRAMYPGHCGYKSETGGLMENLRTSTTNEKIQAYHKAFYRPENLCVIVTGPVKALDVFQALKPVEDNILSKGLQAEFERPWQTPVPPLTDSSHQVISYPCDGDTHGIVYVAWRGPNVKSYEEISALHTLMEYLTDTSVSPLQREFVEKEDAYCSKVSYCFIENLESCFYLSFENVPKQKLHSVPKRLAEVLESLKNRNETIDMKRMATVLHRRKLHILSQMESNPHDTIAFAAIGDFLYGHTPTDLQNHVQQIPTIESLTTKDEPYWYSLLLKRLMSGPSITIVGDPSPSLMKEMAEDEHKRVSHQRKSLGENGLSQKTVILQKALEANEEEPPSNLLNSVAVPSVSSIQFHSILRSSNHTLEMTENVPGFSLQDMPFRFQLDDLHSNFVTMCVIMNTKSVPTHLRLYLPLLIELLLESPVLRNGTLVSYEDVVAELAADTIHSGSSIGIGDGTRFFCGDYAQMAVLGLKVEVEKYNQGIRWLGELLFQTQFPPERIKVMASKLINHVAHLRRKGATVVSALIHNICFCEESNRWVSSMLRQHGFLTKLLENLDTQPNKVVEALQELREHLTRCENLSVHLTVNVPRLVAKVGKDLHSPWLKFLPADDLVKVSWQDAVKCHELLRLSDGDVPFSAIAGIGAVESSFLVQCVPSIDCYSHPDLPALLVLIQYLTQLEGPMWRQIRGQGLSYHYSITLKPSEGLLYFVLYKSTHVISAYQEAKSIVEKVLNGKMDWDEVQLESSRSSLLFELIQKEKSVDEVSLQSLLAYYRGIEMDYTKKLLDKISQVKLEDFNEVAAKYLAPLFDTSLSRCAVCCHPGKVEEVVAGFKEMSRNLTVLGHLEESFLAKL